MKLQLNLFSDQDITPANLSRDDVEVRKVRKQDALGFYIQYHYLKGVGNNAMTYGIYVKNTDDLVACISFQVPCSENVRASVFGEQYRFNVYELGRLAIKDGVQINASMIVPMCIDSFLQERRDRGMSPIYAIVSYADAERDHHGGVYQAMSWMYCGPSKTSKDFYMDQDGRVRHPRQSTRNISKSEAAQRGWSVIKKAGIKHKYLKLIAPTSLFRKKLIKMLKIQPLSYPKPDKSH